MHTILFIFFSSKRTQKSRSIFKMDLDFFDGCGREYPIFSRITQDWLLYLGSFNKGENLSYNGIISNTEIMFLLHFTKQQLF